MKHRICVTLESAEQAERFKALGGSKWLRVQIDSAREQVRLSDEDRARIAKALAESFKTSGEHETAQLLARIAAPTDKEQTA
jgi:hypothetical protein